MPSGLNEWMETKKKRQRDRTDEMKLDKLPKEFTEAKEVLSLLEQAGYEAYFVGGSVRDVILNQPIHDVDIATSAFPEEIKAIFKHTIDVGIEHGTVLVLFEGEQYEITTFRTESTYQDFRRPDEVTFVRSLEEDLKRRDFTMNALALDKDGELVDMFNGIDDIQKGVIRAVGQAEERFFEDALRMMRGLRFASQLTFDIEEKTLEAIHLHHALLEKISVERIYVEWVKLLIGQSAPKGLAPFIKTGSYNYCPGFRGKKEELLLFQELLLKGQVTSEELAWLLLIDTLSITRIGPFFKEWKASNRIADLIKHASPLLTIRKNTGWTKELLYQAGEEQIRLVEEALDYLGYPSQLEEALADYNALPMHHLRDMAINGKALMAYSGKKPGPWLGASLRHLEEKVVAGELANDSGVLLAYWEQTVKG